MKTLAVIFTTLFLLLFSAWFVLSNENALTYILNEGIFKQLDPENPIRISELESVEIGLRNVAFNKVTIGQQNNHVTLHQTHIQIAYVEFIPVLRAIRVAHIDLHFEKTKKETQDKPTREPSSDETRLAELLPQHLYPNAHNITIEIGSLNISAPDYLKQTIKIQKIHLQESQSHLQLSLAEIVLSEKHGLSIDSQLMETGQLSVYVNLLNVLGQSNTDLLVMKLSANEANNGDIHTDWLTEMHFAEISELFQDWLVDTGNITRMQGRISVQGKARFAPVFSNNIALEDLLLSASGQSQLNLDLQLEGVELEAVHVDLDTVFDYQQGKTGNITSVVIHDNSEIKLLPNRGHETFQAEPPLQFLADQHIIIRPRTDAHFIYQHKHFHLQEEFHASWGWDGQSSFVDFSLSQINGSIENDRSVKLAFQHQLRTRWNRFFASRHQASNTLHLKSDRIYFTSRIDEERIKAQIHLEGDFSNNNINLGYNVKINSIANAAVGLNETIPYWDKDLKLIDGKISLKGKANIDLAAPPNQTMAHYQLQLAVKDIDATYDTISFNKMTAQANIKGSDFIFQSEAPFLVKIDEIYSGISLTRFRIETQLDMNLDGLSQIHFSDMKMRVLGGSATSQAFTLIIPFENEQNPDPKAKQKAQPYHAQLNLSLEGLQLKEALALQGNPEIEGKGLLHGYLPITANEKTTLIEGGWIRNQNPGTLQYRPDASTQAMLKQNREMKLFLDVLGHMNYHTLTADIDLDAEGKLKIVGSLQGVNPDFKKGYPIIFNPNIELDLRDMLRSLSFSQDVSGNLTKRVHQKYLD